MCVRGAQAHEVTSMKPGGTCLRIDLGTQRGLVTHPLNPIILGP